MSWKWKDVLQELPFFVPENSQICDVISLLNDNKTDICFVTHIQSREIVGYVSIDSLMRDLSLNKFNHKEHVKPLTNFLYVHEENEAIPIHNCTLVIGANENHDLTGYIFMSDLESQLNDLRLNSLNISLNSAQMGIVILNSSFNIRFMNEQAEQILGVDFSILQGRNYKKLMQITQSFKDITEGDSAFGIENTFNSKVISGQFSPIYEGNNVVGIIHNFYLKEKFKDAVHEVQFVKDMNHYLQTFYEMSDEQILIIEPDGTIEKVSGSFFESFWKGFDQDTLQGLNLYDLRREYIHFDELVTKCLKTKTKDVMKQTRNNITLLSTATPLIQDGHIKKIFILSKNVSLTNDLNKADHKYNDSTVKEIMYRSESVNDLLKDADAVSQFDSTVLISGESGVGKELFAKRIHSLSKRKDAAFIAVNCGAIPENMIESELFGHEKGAFTGAVDTRQGLFEEAHNGTIFLDEIGELPFLMQVKLLRVLQEREVTRVGSSSPIKVNVRVIAATNKNLRQLVHSGHFREDLYYRLHVVPIIVPPLRERKEDIAPLVIHFLNHFNEQLSEKKSISPEAISMLETHLWPGNVRELENMIERLTVTTASKHITEEDVYHILWPSYLDNHTDLIIHKIVPLKEAVEETEKQLIELAMQTYDTATEAAKALDVSVSTMSRRMQKYNHSGGSI